MISIYRSRPAGGEKPPSGSVHKKLLSFERSKRQSHSEQAEIECGDALHDPLGHLRSRLVHFYHGDGAPKIDISTEFLPISSLLVTFLIHVTCLEFHRSSMCLCRVSVASSVLLAAKLNTAKVWLIRLKCNWATCILGLFS